MKNFSVFCENCGNSVSLVDDFCPYCHTKLGDVECPSCHFAAPSSAFLDGCPKCNYDALGLGVSEKKIKKYQKFYSSIKLNLFSDLFLVLLTILFIILTFLLHISI